MAGSEGEQQEERRRHRELKQKHGAGRLVDGRVVYRELRGWGFVPITEKRRTVAPGR